MNIVKNVDLKKGLKRPDIALKRLAKDDTVFAVVLHESVAVIGDDGQVVATIDPWYSVVSLEELVRDKSRIELEALYLGIVTSKSNVWLMRLACT